MHWCPALSLFGADRKKRCPFPPDYIKLPPSIACAGVDDALIVTMARILGLCWDQKYPRSPAYTPDQLAGLLGRSGTTLYRHLNKLQELHWMPDCMLLECASTRGMPAIGPQR